LATPPGEPHFTIKEHLSLLTGDTGMRIWDIPPETLCDRHLLGEHAEEHAIWSVLTGGKKGYSRHPETLRWKGKLKALYARHEAVVREMSARGFSHRSPLEKTLAVGEAVQNTFVDKPAQQIQILKDKGCECTRRNRW
jgi:Pyrimidine dimer DNA glycosylase